jgi:hypothetical protein
VVLGRLVDGEAMTWLRRGSGKKGAEDAGPGAAEIVVVMGRGGVLWNGNGPGLGDV